MTAPDPGLTDLIAAHDGWGYAVHLGLYYCQGDGCNLRFADLGEWAAHVALVVEQHANRRMAELEARVAELELLHQVDQDLFVQALTVANQHKATVARVTTAVNTAAAHRFDFDNTSIEGPGGKVGGPNNFFNGNRYVTNHVRAALEGQ